MASGNIALPEEPNLILSKGANNRVENSTVMEKHEISFLPVVGVDEMRRDTRPLEVVDDISDLGEIIDDRPVPEVESPHGRRMDLEGELCRDGIPPAHGQDLDIVVLDGWQLVGRQLSALRDQA